MTKAMEIVEKSEQDKNKNNTTATKNMGSELDHVFCDLRVLSPVIKIK